MTAIIRPTNYKTQVKVFEADGFNWVLIRAKQNGFDFSMREAINRMESHGIYLSQQVVDFALKQANEM